MRWTPRRAAAGAAIAGGHAPPVGRSGDRAGAGAAMVPVRSQQGRPWRPATAPRPRKHQRPRMGRRLRRGSFVAGAAGAGARSHPRTAPRARCPTAAHRFLLNRRPPRSPKPRHKLPSAAAERHSPPSRRTDRHRLAAALSRPRRLARRMGDLYRLSGPDTLQRFRQGRDDLIRSHPQSPLAPEARQRFGGLKYFDADPTVKIRCRIEPAERGDPLEIDTGGADGVITYWAAGRLAFHIDGQPCTLTVFSLVGYGGGLFLPF